MKTPWVDFISWGRSSRVRATDDDLAIGPHRHRQVHILYSFSHSHTVLSARKLQVASN